jgi:hypothetical protein
MPLPGDLQAVICTGTFLDAAGDVLRGNVTFAPSSVLTDGTGSVVVLKARTYQLAAGSFRTDPLAATDNTDLQPAGWRYTVTIAIEDAQPLTYSLPIPHEPSPVDLSALIAAAG